MSEGTSVDKVSLKETVEELPIGHSAAIDVIFLKKRETKNVDRL